VIKVTLCYFKIIEFSLFMYGLYLTEFELLNCTREIDMVVLCRSATRMPCMVGREALVQKSVQSSNPKSSDPSEFRCGMMECSY
jgi:hypothetical protein